MSSSSKKGSKARMDLSVDPGLKVWYHEWCHSQGRDMSEDIEDYIRSLQGKDTRNPVEVEEKGLEAEQKVVEDKLEGLEGGKHDRERELASALAEFYVKLNQDWRGIRFQALEDFRKETGVGWIEELGVKSERQVAEACRVAADLKELRGRRDELRRRLDALYATGLEKEGEDV